MTSYIHSKNAGERGGVLPLQTTGQKDMTLLKQIRLWMKTRTRGEQYHDIEHDSIIEPYYFDISPEVMIPEEEYLEEVTEDFFEEFEDLDEPSKDPLEELPRAS
jgi:hypothetical protein